MESQNVSTGKKLFASFSFVILVILVMTAFSFIIIGQLEEFRRDVRKISATQDSIEATRNLQLQLANVRQIVTDASLRKDRQAIEEKARPSFDKALSDIAKLMELNKNNSEQLTKLEALKKDLSVMWETGDRMFNGYIVRLENGNAVLHEFDTVSGKALKDTAAIAEAQIINYKDGATDISKKVGRALHWITVEIIVNGILGSLFAVFIFRIRKSVLKPLHDK